MARIMEPVKFVMLLFKNRHGRAFARFSGATEILRDSFTAYSEILGDAHFEAYLGLPDGMHGFAYFPNDVHVMMLVIWQNVPVNVAGSTL